MNPTPRNPQEQDAAASRESRTLAIRHLNYVARTAMGVACILNQTPGITVMHPRDQSRIREAVEKYNGFTKADDPYGEQDFGSFRFTPTGDDSYETIFWKIDYYDKASFAAGREVGAENPADASTTQRILTIMLATEY